MAKKQLLQVRESRQWNIPQRKKSTLGEEHEGPRMKRLRKVFDKALDRSISSVLKKHKFEDLFVGLDPIALATAGNNSAGIPCSKAYRNMLGHLQIQIASEFETICKERDITTRLNELDRLIEQHSGTEFDPVKEDPAQFLDIELPSELKVLPGNEAVAKRVALKKKEIENLHSVLRQLEEDNKAVGQSLAETEKTKNHLDSSLTRVTDEFEKVNKVAAQWEKLQTESWTRETKLRRFL